MNEVKVLGFGSPILDLLVQVDDAFLSRHVSGEKGGMGMLDAGAQKKLIGLFPAGQVRKAVGGSAFNTISALTLLGMRTSFLGKIGQDEDGDYYRNAYQTAGGDVSRFRVSPTEPTATCVSLVTPDSERTMRTSLGASSTLTPDEITGKDFAGITHFHAEGYMLFLPGVLAKALKLAKENGCTVSFDFSSFEVVRLFRSEIEELMGKYVDVIFANEDEAREFCGQENFDPETAVEELQKRCPVAAVKLGKKGALLKENGKVCRIEPKIVKAVDTTGAGDLWQAGFLYGWLNGLGLQKAGEMGSVLGAEVVQIIGAALPPERWPEIKKQFNQIKGC
ncbi:MAG: adenosine kinase [Lentisphaeria bacterium]|nr:adenosine kinase [Lentisphaeria bacterium]